MRPQGGTTGPRLTGYYWANLLTEEHVALLGGVDRVLLEAPCDVRESVERDAPPAVYLQTTADVHDFDDSRLRTLRSYLAPLLPGDPEREAKAASRYPYRLVT